MTMTKQCLKPSRNGTKTVFEEKKHHHWKNRQDAYYAVVKPAILANGEPGVWLRIGGTFAVLSKEEFAALSERVAEVITTVEQENTK